MTSPAPSVTKETPALTCALAGNPNAGKTTIFNNLTGARQRVGNYPGVTVECKAGAFQHAGRSVSVVDLPGIYSLTAYTEDELVSRRFVIEERPDVVVDVVDASNLERHLYLAVQFMELGLPLVLAFNMADTADRRGYRIDMDRLSHLLGVTIVRTVGHKGEGMEQLRAAMVAVGSAERPQTPTTVRYGREVEQELSVLTPLVAELPGPETRPVPRWLAVKLLEGDAEVERTVYEAAGERAAALSAAVHTARERVRTHFGDAPEIVIADQRYGFISGACQEAVQATVEMRHSRSDRIDEVLTNRLFGMPIFLAMMYFVFKLAFTLGEPPMRWIEWLFAWLGILVERAWPDAAPAVLQSLLVDGILAGVGGVLVFVPTIALLFFAIAALEDSGYMARAAFIMDGVMHRIGLHGKSFIPMMIGFGCTVPAILATRTLESRRDRLATMLVLPLFSCGARLPIYTLFIGAFFAERWRTPVLMSLYLTGVVAAVLLARLLRSTLLRGESDPFVMELPPYRLPTVRALLSHTWERAWLFVRKAGTIIVVISVIMWTISSYPRLPDERASGLEAGERAQAALAYSLAGRMGHALEPVMRHVGFDWKTSTALVGAIAAKEVFVAQLGIVNSLGDAGATSEPLRAVLQREYTALQAYCIMLFCLISMPCCVTVVATWKESRSIGFALLQFVGLTVLAYGVTFVVYQVGSAIGALV